MYRQNPRRTGTVENVLQLPLRPAWVYRPARPPQPAWPPHPRLLNKGDFDYAPHPVITAGRLYFGSTADDSVHCLDTVTGKHLWRFTTGGPVRFAPQIEAGRAYVASDDGHVYCLDAVTGRELWRFQAAPESEQYIGNRRMISRWPLRCGLLVVNGAVYTVAGMWPAEGIYVYALDAVTGDLIWVNDRNSLGLYSPSFHPSRWRAHDPHAGEFSMVGLTPQGPLLLAGDDMLAVPLFENSRALFNTKNGRLVEFLGRGVGSTRNFIDGDHLFFLTFLRGEGLQLFGSRAHPARRVQPKRFRGDELPQFTTAAYRSPRLEHGSTKIDTMVHNGKLYARRAFGLALTRNALLEGRAGVIAATDPETGAELWCGQVNGEAREIAVADGRVYVGSSSGEIACFAPARDNGIAAPVLHREPTVPAPEFVRQPAPPVAKTVTLLRQLTMDKGFALVLGDAEGSVSAALVKATGLQVLNVQTDPGAAAALRERLLDNTPWYGSRIQVQTVASLEKLPFAQYFANAVIVASGVPGPAAAGELFRVLRPYGGVLVFLEPAADPNKLLPPPAPANAAVTWRLEKADGLTAVIRGELPGARNWNANTDSDRRVKWPLRPLWFGGPDTDNIVNRQLGAHQPVAADGRWFATGNDTLSAIDTYNGTTLWTRPVPGAEPDTFTATDSRQYFIRNGISARSMDQWGKIKRWLATDSAHVYLRLGQDFFRGQGEAIVQVDARTGAQTKLFAPNLPATDVSLRMPQTWSIEVDDKRGGSVAVKATAAGIAVALTAVLPEITAADTWDLFFDLRPAAERRGLYNHGTFMLRLPLSEAVTGKPIWLPGTGAAHPQPALSGGPTTGGVTLELLLPWQELEKLNHGHRPESFGFAATLTVGLGDEPQTRGEKVIAWHATVTQAHLFSDALAPALNNGWANLYLGDTPAEPGTPAILAGTVNDRPANWPWPEISEFKPRPGIDDYVGHPGRIEDTVRSAPRQHPLTSEPGPRVYRTGTGGCGLPVFSSTTMFGRTNKLSLGIYDFADDSGLRFFPGISPNCGAQAKAINMSAVLGLLIHADSRTHCVCMIPVRTTVVFAPAERRLREDWAIFSDRDADAPVGQASINLGAIGDRRDAAGRLWLRFPRTSGGKAYPLAPGTWDHLIESPAIGGAMAVPLKLEPAEKSIIRHYQQNTDRTPVTGTDRPWIYTSWSEGVGRAVLELEPVPPLSARTWTGELVLDGKLNENAWIPLEDLTDAQLAGTGAADTVHGKPEVSLDFNRTDLFARFDDKTLYFGFRRQPSKDRRGIPEPWVAETKGENAQVWNDDSFEIFLTAAGSSAVVHLGLAASGARYSALNAAGKPADHAWNGAWRCAVQLTPELFSAEIAVPWQTLEQAGIDRERLQFNFQANRKGIDSEVPVYPGGIGRVVDEKKGISQALVSLGPEGRSRCRNFVGLGLGQAPAATERNFLVRLHFVEPRTETLPGERVFDVLVQGRKVLENFDIAATAGAPYTVVIREFRNIRAAAGLTVEFVPRPTPGAKLKLLPLLCALEIMKHE